MKDYCGAHNQYYEDECPDCAEGVREWKEAQARLLHKPSDYDFVHIKKATMKIEDITAVKENMARSIDSIMEQDEHEGLATRREICEYGYIAAVRAMNNIYNTEFRYHHRIHAEAREELLRKFSSMEDPKFTYSPIFQQVFHRLLKRSDPFEIIDLLVTMHIEQGEKFIEALKNQHR